MTKRIRQQAPDGAHCYSTGSGRYLRVGDDGSVSYWRGGYWSQTVGHPAHWVPMPGYTEDDLWVADGIIWLDGRGYRLLWVSALVILLGVACMVVLR